MLACSGLLLQDLGSGGITSKELLMPTWLLEVLLVWAYKPRSFYLILIGISAWIFVPLLAQWYWTGVELQGQFKLLEHSFGEKYIHKADKVGFIIMVGCFVSAYKAFKKDRKKL